MWFLVQQNAGIFWKSHVKNLWQNSPMELQSWSNFMVKHVHWSSCSRAQLKFSSIFISFIHLNVFYYNSSGNYLKSTNIFCWNMDCVNLEKDIGDILIIVNEFAWLIRTSFSIRHDHFEIAWGKNSELFATSRIKKKGHDCAIYKVIIYQKRVIWEVTTIS